MRRVWGSPLDTRVPVVVIYRGGNGALAVARTLGRQGIRVYLVSQQGASPVQSSRFWTKRFYWDFAAPREQTVEFLRGVSREIGTRPILLTLADWAAFFIEQNADALKDAFIFPKAAGPVVQALGNKWSMFAMAREHGVPTPETVYPQSRREVLEFLKTARFPVVMKSADPLLPHVPSKAIVENERELLEKYDRDAQLGPPNVILQEYIPGDAQTVWMCNAYFDANSECRAIFTGKKLRQVSDTGIASLAVCLPNDAVADATRRFMQGAGYVGAVGIGYRYDARDGLYKVLDVNPRVSGIFRLFRGSNGLDVVRAAYLDLTGQPVPESALSAGRKWLLEDDFFAALAARRKGKLTLRQWVESLSGTRELHWFAADDPLPGFVWLWQNLRERARSKVRRKPANEPLITVHSR